MSLKTWKATACPVPASDAVATELDAAQHCLRKWRSLTKKNLDKHGLQRDFCMLEGIATDECFPINDRTCALCIYNDNFEECDSCILTQLRGVACDRQCDITVKAPYVEFSQHGDPQPMIRLLRKAVKVLAGRVAQMVNKTHEAE